jgi:peptide/nickel transport system permease protein
VSIVRRVLARVVSLRRRWGIGGTIGLAWLALVLFAAVAGPFLVGEIDQDLFGRLAAPSLSHPFGTNNLGQDLFALCIEGARVSALVGVSATAIGVLVGVPIGLAAALYRGIADRLTLVFLDTFAAFPSFVASVAAVLFFGKSVRNIVLIIGILSAPFFARISRTLAMSLSERDFILAARMLGARNARIVLRDLLPNVSRTVSGFALISVGVAISIEGGLSFFGAGVPDDVVTWGQLISEGRARVDTAPHVSLLPAALILFTILALNAVSERWQQGAPTGVLIAEVADPVDTGAARAVAPDVALAADPAPDAVLSVRGLHTHLQTPFGPLRAVDGVSFDLRRGETLAVVGESGSGKTMLARSILGLVPSPPLITGTGGSIRFEGRELLGADEATLRSVRGRGVAMVFQDPMTTLDPVMRIGRQIAEPAMLHLGLSKSAAMARARELLAEVGVPDPDARLRAWPHELSGGLRQRVSVAIALAAEPRVLIADEPTSALDVTVQRQLLDLLAELGRSRGLSVMLITHDMGVVAQRADRVMVMYSGRIVEEGETGAVFERPRMPYTRALLAAIPRVSEPSHTRLAVIGGVPPVPLGPRIGCAFSPRCGLADEMCLRDAPALRGGRHRVACHHAVL